MTNKDLNAHNFSFTNHDGKRLMLNKFQGKAILIVNTASKCGFTPQYEELENLWKEYKRKGLVVVAVPSNDFGKQEPGTDKEIQNFCETKFNVTFPVMKKEHVRGKQAHPFYAWAAEQVGFKASPKWNFHKYLIDKNGNLVNWFSSATKPTSKKIKEDLDKLL